MLEIEAAGALPLRCDGAEDVDGVDVCPGGVETGADGIGGVVLVRHEEDFAARAGLATHRPGRAAGDAGGEVHGEDALALIRIADDERELAQGDAAGPEPAHGLGGDFFGAHGKEAGGGGAARGLGLPIERGDGGGDGIRRCVWRWAGGLQLFDGAAELAQVGGEFTLLAPGGDAGGDGPEAQAAAAQGGPVRDGEIRTGGGGGEAEAGEGGGGGFVPHPVDRPGDGRGEQLGEHEEGAALGRGRRLAAAPGAAVVMEGDGAGVERAAGLVAEGADEAQAVEQGGAVRRAPGVHARGQPAGAHLVGEDATEVVAGFGVGGSR